MYRATISGSFRRHLRAVEAARRELVEHDVHVLSPLDTHAVDERQGFIFLAGDPSTDVKQTEDRHLACITQSDFLWLVSPDGYIGPSTALEIGWAVGAQVPVLCTRLPHDECDGLTDITNLVHVVTSVREAVELLRMQWLEKLHDAHRQLAQLQRK